MRKYSPHLDPAADQVALTGWIVTDMALAGLDRAGPCPTRAEFIAALRALDDYDADGLLAAPVDFEAGFGQLTTCYSFVRVTPDGTAFEIVGPVPYCGSQPAPDGVATVAPAG
jgi:hypothetical protein